jgi:hypothetical protein
VCLQPPQELQVSCRRTSGSTDPRLSCSSRASILASGEERETQASPALLQRGARSRTTTHCRGQGQIAVSPAIAAVAPAAAAQ